MRADTRSVARTTTARIWISAIANLALAVLGVLLFIGSVTAGAAIGLWLRGM